MEDFESNIIVKYRHPLVNECECSYSRLVERMLDEKFTKDWMIEDELTVSHQFGDSIFTIHFYQNGKATIYSFHKNRPTGADLMDLRALVIFLMKSGWKRPCPFSGEVDYAIEFWKDAWETGLVDSEYLEKKFGVRKIFN